MPSQAETTAKLLANVEHLTANVQDLTMQIRTNQQITDARIERERTERIEADRNLETQIHANATWRASISMVLYVLGWVLGGGIGFAVAQLFFE